MELPTFDDVRRAQARIAAFVHRTPVLTSASVDAWVGCRVLLKAEHLQRSGAFKYRGATNAVRSLTPERHDRGVVAHSSGNHAGALALAARILGIPAQVVMPEGATASKRAAAVGFGAVVHDCAPTLAAREATVADLIERTGATEVHPSADLVVIAGAGTVCLELLDDHPELEAVVAPLGGGGLLSGTVLSARGRRERSLAVFGAEPSGADDAARSLRGGALVVLDHPDTICDGLRTTLSPRTFTVLQAGLDEVITVDDAETLLAMDLLWARAKQVVEPSGAIALAAARRLVQTGRLPADATVGVILSGGNVDLPMGRPADAGPGRARG
jgi:threonine dehydratase